MWRARGHLLRRDGRRRPHGAGPIDAARRDRRPRVARRRRSPSALRAAAHARQRAMGAFSPSSAAAPSCSRAGAFDARRGAGARRARSVNVLTVVGDAMARPLLDALAADPVPTTTCRRCSCSPRAARSSRRRPRSRSRAAARTSIIDRRFGVDRDRVRAPCSDADGGRQAARSRSTTARRCSTTTCDRSTPGSGVVGRLARRGHVPLGYYKDAAKTAATFVEIDGERWALPGDIATVDADGTIVLLGRGSVCINTGGEKVYPEEVEAVLKGHPGVFDAVVVGLPDERWGERVAAVVATAPATPFPRSTRSPPSARMTSPATSCRGDCCWSTRSAGPQWQARLWVGEGACRGCPRQVGATTPEPPGDEAHDHDLPT